MNTGERVTLYEMIAQQAAFTPPADEIAALLDMCAPWATGEGNT